MTTEWVLPSDTTAAGAAREHVRGQLAAIGVVDGAALDDAVLVASELAANGVRHGQPPVLLAVTVSDDVLRIEVSDAGTTGKPTPGEAHEHAGSGRGLAMVARLARDTGWSRADGRTRVWADVPLSRGAAPSR